MRPTLLALLLALSGARAAETDFTAIAVDPARDRLALFWRDEADRPFNGFAAIEQALKPQRHHLRFAMNAGMFHPDFSPVGLLVIDGQEMAPLNLDEGAGNFFLKPNGVFLQDQDGFRIVESSEYPTLTRPVRLATQSGPLLLRRGKIHPRFDPDSPSRLIRNGVGLCAGRAVFVLSEQPVNFHEFARYFRDRLGCDDALYLDGTISSLYRAEPRRHLSRGKLGPIVGVVDPDPARR